MTLTFEKLESRFALSVSAPSVDDGVGVLDDAFTPPSSPDYDQVWVETYEPAKEIPAGATTDTSPLNGYELEQSGALPEWLVTEESPIIQAVVTASEGQFSPSEVLNDDVLMDSALGRLYGYFDPSESLQAFSVDYQGYIRFQGELQTLDSFISELRDNSVTGYQATVVDQTGDSFSILDNPLLHIGGADSVSYLEQADGTIRITLQGNSVPADPHSMSRQHFCIDIELKPGQTFFFPPETPPHEKPPVLPPPTIAPRTPVLYAPEVVPAVDEVWYGSGGAVLNCCDPADEAISDLHEAIVDEIFSEEGDLEIEARAALYDPSGEAIDLAFEELFQGEDDIQVEEQGEPVEASPDEPVEDGKPIQDGPEQEGEEPQRPGKSPGRFEAPDPLRIDKGTAYVKSAVDEDGNHQEEGDTPKGSLIWKAAASILASGGVFSNLFKRRSSFFS